MSQKNGNGKEIDICISILKIVLLFPLETYFFLQNNLNLLGTMDHWSKTSLFWKKQGNKHGWIQPNLYTFEGQY